MTMTKLLLFAAATSAASAAKVAVVFYGEAG